VSRRIGTGVLMRFVALLHGAQQLDIAAHLHDVLPTEFELTVRYTDLHSHLRMTRIEYPWLEGTSDAFKMQNP
jgi:hypothetical protein